MNQTSRRSPAQRIATVTWATAESLSADSMTRLRKVHAEIRAYLEAQEPVSNRTREPASQEAQEPSSVDAAWVVMEAANDFGDQATIDTCRRVIDASLNGALAAQSDVAIINNYFK